jgi:molybdenum cofactor cytidylyltransferase
MSSAPLAAIILAAGYSSRMGRFKPLIELEGQTISRRLIAMYRELKIDSYLVVGWQSAELRRALTIAPDQIVENPDFAEGMFSSIRAGLRALPNQPYRSFFIHPVDVPLVRPFSLQRLLAVNAQDPGAILYPCFGGRRGHPPLISISLAPSILDWQGGGGLHGFLQTHEEMAREVNLADSNILFDIDTPDTLPELERRFQSLSIPDGEECAVILQELYAVPEKVRKHCAAVAELAGEIARALKTRGADVNLDLVQAAAALHDLCKGQPQHELAAAALLREMGFPEVAGIVEKHTELGDQPDLRLETKVVFLADKLVHEERRIHLVERYDAARRKFARSAEALQGIERRQNEAQQIQKEFEDRLGFGLDQVVFKRLE